MGDIRALVRPVDRHVDQPSDPGLPDGPDGVQSEPGLVGADRGGEEDAVHAVERPPEALRIGQVADRRFDPLKVGDERRRRLAAKNRHNAVTIALFLLVRWAYLVTVAWLGTVAGVLYGRFGTPAIAVDEILSLLIGVLCFVLVERASTGFRALRPQFCSIYDRIFWRHERFWKLSGMAHLGLFNGTAFKGSIWRLLGVDVGRRLFDDGCSIPERTLVSMGDDCALSAESVIQGHSLEDGTFKSERIVIGSGCTLGTRAFVHYGVTMGEGATLDAHSFLMKGEETAPQARWRGNPAREVDDGPSLAAARTTREAVRPSTSVRELVMDVNEELARLAG